MKQDTIQGWKTEDDQSNVTMQYVQYKQVF